MQTTTLGRTNICVPIYGFGGIPVGRDHLTDEEGADIVRRAIDEGIVLIDTFCNYGRSEIRIGKAIEGRRDEVVIVTKSRGSYEPVEFSEMIEQSLSNLGVDYIDILLLKNIDNEDSLAKVEANAAVLQKMQKEGKVRFTGLSSHSPEHSCKALQTGLLDVAELPYNYANTQFDVVLDLAEELDVGILAMKPLGGGRLFEGLEKGGAATFDTLKSALSFARSHPCEPVLIPGIGTQDELNRYLEVIPQIEFLDEAGRRELIEKATDLGDDFCRTCGYCRQVCPGGVVIDEVLPLLDRVKHIKTDHTYKSLMKKKFFKVVQNSGECEGCGKCIEECPYDLPIPGKIKEAYEVFGS